MIDGVIAPKGDPILTDMIQGDLQDEEYREYLFANGTVYRIKSPKTLYFHRGGSTHRVLDNEGIVHIVPSVGINGTVLRFKPKNVEAPVQF